MFQALLTIAGTYLMIIIVDVVWLKYIAGNWLTEQIQSIARESVYIPSAFIVWLIMSFGIWYFILQHAPTPLTALYQGAILGFLLYAVFDFTNHAILKGYPYSFIIADILWGTILVAIVSASIAYLQQIVW